MFLYIELWKPRPAWDNLPCEQREEFLSILGPNVSRMKELGVELIGFAVNEDAPAGDTGYRYMAVWKMPNRGHVHMLEKAVKDEGWDNYFTISVASGKVLKVNDFVGDMVKA